MTSARSDRPLTNQVLPFPRPPVPIHPGNGGGGGPCGCEDGTNFCNYDAGETGTCQSCDDFSTAEECKGESSQLSAAGATDCEMRCFGPTGGNGGGDSNGSADGSGDGSADGSGDGSGSGSGSGGADGSGGDNYAPTNAEMMCVFDAITGGTGGDTPMTEADFEQYHNDPTSFQSGCEGTTYAPTPGTTLELTTTYAPTPGTTLELTTTYAPTPGDTLETTTQGSGITAGPPAPTAAEVFAMLDSNEDSSVDADEWIAGESGRYRTANGSHNFKPTTNQLSGT
jgi:hypothetical protein